MNDIALSVKNLGKRYQLGAIGRHTLGEEIKHFWLKFHGKDPKEHMGQVGHPSDPSKNIHPEFWALDHINFELKQGEILGVIGGNGAGKSTLLKVLSRITEPTTGEAKIRGRVGSLLEVGTGFHPELTGRENVFMNGTLLGMKRKEVANKFDEIVAFSGVEKFIDTPVKRYSSGMYIRLAFAVAAHLEPEILIVDEVLAVGDANFQKKCLGKMSEVAKDGRTILFVSHNMATLQSLCTQCMVLQKGKCVFGPGNTEEAISFYLSQNRKNAATPLASRTDRKGYGRVHMTDVELRDPVNNTTCTHFISGRPATLRIYYTQQIAGEILDVEFKIDIRTKASALLSVLSNHMSQTIFPEIHGRGYVECTLDKWPFAEGHYLLNLKLESQTLLEDSIEDALILEVEGGDFYGTGRGFPTKNEGVMVAQTWHQAPTPESTA
ncbi:ABC transporter ATP-binding protein [Kiritimatiellota bacterium B12222]|nr:ABC transporter ATP-binding protein [Kiritimatiellota bacterium B12222]